MTYDIYVGSQVGELTLLSRMTSSVTPKWRCQCSCGRKAHAFEEDLRYGRTLCCPNCERKMPNPEGCQHRDCRYYSAECMCCIYFIAKGHTRTSLHQDEEGVDINNPCREYEPGEKALNKYRFARLRDTERRTK
jgi:hypothetical protein